MKQGYMKAVLLMCIACCYIFPCALSAKSPAENADELFQLEKYQEALDIWYGLVQSGNSSAGIYYNIGVAESMLQHPPKAILAFEKALRFSPTNKRINQALTQERKKIEGNVIPVPDFFLFRWIRSLASILRPGYWAMVGLLLLVLAVFRFVNTRTSTKLNRYTNQKSLFVLLAMGIMLLCLGGLSYHQLYRMDEAIVHVQCDFRRAPTEDSPQIRSLFAGEKVKVTDQLGGWYQVHLLNLDEGWIKSDCLEFIIIDQEKSTKE